MSAVSHLVNNLFKQINIKVINKYPTEGCSRQGLKTWLWSGLHLWWRDFSCWFKLSGKAPWAILRCVATIPHRERKRSWKCRIPAGQS